MNEVAQIKFAENYEMAAALFDKLDVRPSTRDDYKYRIKHYLQFVSGRNFNPDILLDYKDSLRADISLSVATKNKYLTTARAFLREMEQQNPKLTGRIRTNVKNFQQNKKHKVFGLDEYDVARLLQWMNDHPEKLRERAILCLLILQGLRQAEICSLNFYEVDLEGGVMLVRSKGMDDKEVVHLHAQTLRELAAYMAKRKKTLQPSDVMLFASQRGRAAFSGELTVRGLQDIVKRIFKDAGVNRTVHGTRHFFTTHLIKHMDGSLLQVAQFTRHKSIQTLQIYNDAILAEEDVRSFQNAFNGVAASLRDQPV